MKCLKETEKTQEELSGKAPKLVIKQQELEKLIDDFRARHGQIKVVKQLVLKKEVEINVELGEAIEVQRICDKNFREKVPQFIKANEGLQKITKKQIEELICIREPSQTLLGLSKATCIIMNVPPSVI
jgi:hypothetical protein